MILKGVPFFSCDAGKLAVSKFAVLDIVRRNYICHGSVGHLHPNAKLLSPYAVISACVGIALVSLHHTDSLKLAAPLIIRLDPVVRCRSLNCHLV